MFAGHVMTGGVVSVTVIVNVQLVSGLFGDESVAVQVTVVTPTAKVDPDAGVHVTDGLGQLSVAVGTV